MLNRTVVGFVGDKTFFKGERSADINRENGTRDDTRIGLSYVIPVGKKQEGTVVSHVKAYVEGYVETSSKLQLSLQYVVNA